MPPRQEDAGNLAPAPIPEEARLIINELREEIMKLRDELEDLNEKLKAQTTLAMEVSDTNIRLGFKIEKLEEENDVLKSRLTAAESKTKF